MFLLYSKFRFDLALRWIEALNFIFPMKSVFRTSWRLPIWISGDSWNWTRFCKQSVVCTWGNQLILSVYNVYVSRTGLPLWPCQPCPSGALRLLPQPPKGNASRRKLRSWMEQGSDGLSQGCEHSRRERFASSTLLCALNAAEPRQRR